MTVPRRLAHRTDIETFIDVMFRDADPDTYISFRVFGDQKRDQPPLIIRSMRVGSPERLNYAYACACEAANFPDPAVYAPPVATFRTELSAKEQNLANGLALSVECDARPAAALERLSALLGPPTFVIESGGLWCDPGTGEIQPKLHLHWKLSKPTTGLQGHVGLRALRCYASDLVGSDATNKAIVHPIRWPGSWHRKGEPRLARIVSSNEDNVIDLDASLQLFRDLPPSEFVRPPNVIRGKSNPRKTALIEDIRAALEVIPNTSDEWDDWNHVALATWAASDGEMEGFDAFDAWSEKHRKYDREGTEGRWAHITDHPPDRIGFGTLRYLAGRAVPGWVAPSKAFVAESWFDADQRTGTMALVDGVYVLQASGNTSAAPSGEMSSKPRLGDNAVTITEDEAAIRFVDEKRDVLRYCYDHGAWFEWTGTHWKENRTKLVFHWAREHVRRLAEGEDHKIRVTLGKAAFADAVERYARADQIFAVTGEHWDQDPWLLGTPGGTVDLATGVLRPARPVDGITKLTGATPSAGQDCPRWLAFLDETTDGDAGLIRFLAQWAGYCLTGDTREHALAFVYGSGGNGKSVFLNVLTGIMADYAVTSAMETFTASIGEKHTTDLAMLKGARLVTASETEEGRAWAEARIKALTGGEPITARFMRQNNFTFRPTFKLTIAGNHKPLLRNVDDAARRRFNMLPFTQKPAKPDRSLEQTLRREWPGILRWMITGCLDWKENGLVQPASVTMATNDYFEEQDTAADWLQERCLIEIGNDRRRTSSQALFDSWSAFARMHSEPAGTMRGLCSKLQNLGLVPSKHVQTSSGRVRGFTGIELRNLSSEVASL